jgi:hypothetical protein
MYPKRHKSGRDKRPSARECVREKRQTGKGEGTTDIHAAKRMDESVLADSTDASLVRSCENRKREKKTADTSFSGKGREIKNKLYDHDYDGISFSADDYIHVINYLIVLFPCFSLLFRSSFSFTLSSILIPLYQPSSLTVCMKIWGRNIFFLLVY